MPLARGPFVRARVRGRRQRVVEDRSKRARRPRDAKALWKDGKGRNDGTLGFFQDAHFTTYRRHDGMDLFYVVFLMVQNKLGKKPL